MNNNKKKWVAAVASVAFLAACTQVPSWNAPASTSQAPAPPAGVPVTVTCAQGQQALVKQVTLAGQTVSQVECVAMPVVASRELNVLEDTTLTVPQPEPRRVAPARRVVRRAPVVRDEPRYEPRDEPIDDRDEPRVYRTSTSSREADSRETTVRKTRPGEKSALIIAGSTAAGAGVGAIVGGKKGALIGAILGGVGGTVYDRKTRHGK